MKQDAGRPSGPDEVTDWLGAAAAAGVAPRAFAQADWVVRSWLGYLVLLGSLWALWYHFLAGIRHFFYDAGLLLNRQDAHQVSWFIIVGSVVLTVLTLILFVF